jgi:DNA-binding protein H-NS
VPKSLSQLTAQIKKLQKEADALKAKEVKGVITRIKEAIRDYRLAASDLGFGPRAPGTKTAGRSAAKKGSTRGNRKTAGVPMYRGPEGQTWTGRGRAPNWFKSALEAGATRESLLLR